MSTAMHGPPAYRSDRGYGLSACARGLSNVLSWPTRARDGHSHSSVIGTGTGTGTGTAICLRRGPQLFVLIRGSPRIGAALPAPRLQWHEGSIQHRCLWPQSMAPRKLSFGCDR